MQLSQKQIADFQKKILTWYATNKRNLPWRQTNNHYHILISEVMSQQTQISRVIPKYEAWIKKFPTIESLAKAKVSSILVYWSGLGYNRRALNLKKTAEIIVNNYSGIFPQDEKELQKLPGIGEYTSRAILCFAFHKQVAVVDTNVRKVILVHFFSERAKRVEEPSTSSGKNNLEKEIQTIAEQLLPAGKAYDWNQALMDYAAAVLKKEKIAIPKQSKFIGSHRYYRGQILKQLLVKKKIPVVTIGFLIKKDFQVTENTWLENLLQELVNEGFIFLKNKYVLLNE